MPARTIDGAAEHWPNSCVPLTVHLDGLPGVTAAQARAAATAAARSWSRESIPCTNLDIVLSFAGGAGPPSGNDGEAVIGHRPDAWCPADQAPKAQCLSPSAVAATTVFAGSKTGVVLDGDIQLNDVTVLWSVADRPPPDTDHQDLQAALTHEIGHLLGFQHPCWEGFGPRATDAHGQPVPDCYDAPDDLRTSVMFPATTPGDVSKRILSADDQRAVCETYPAVGPPVTCPGPPPTVGCSVGRGAPAPGAMLVLAAALLWRRRRR